MIKHYLLLFLLFSYCLVCHAQWRLTSEPVSVQREYFQRFIDTGDCGDACLELLAVARTNQWVLPMLEPALVELRRDEKTNHDKFLRFLFMIAGIGNKEALDMVIRVLDGHPQKGLFVGATLRGNMDSSSSNHFDLWYYALEHEDRIVREAAEEVVSVQIGHPAELRQRRWAESALKRYGHPPSLSDWQSDPMMKVFWQKHPSDAPDKQKHITALAEAIKKSK